MLDRRMDTRGNKTAREETATSTSSMGSSRRGARRPHTHQLLGLVNPHVSFVVEQAACWDVLLKRVGMV